MGDIGFACGGSQFLKSELIKTTDGGETWQIVPLPIDKGVKQLYALDVLADGTLEIAGFDGVTFHSDNFASDITFKQEPRWKPWRSVCYRTPNEAILCGQEGLKEGYLSTIKRQESWGYSYSEEIHSFGMHHISFADSLTGYVAGFGAIYRTQDGGQTWDFTSAKNDYFTSTAWFTNTEGVAIGWEGSILRTENGGDDWETIRKATKLGQKKIRLKSLAKNNINELVAVGDKGCILFSKDTGRNWKFIDESSELDFESVAFKDNSTFFAVGKDGRIFKIQL